MIPANPYSPYATAAADVRHVASTVLVDTKPVVGTLALTACGHYAVALGEDPPVNPVGGASDGVCPACMQSLRGDPPHDLHDVFAVCEECGLKTRHGRWCGLCREDLHDTWRLTIREVRR